MDKNFLLYNETAIKLYNNYAKDMPIIDYHCHLNPQEIFENKKFKNITEAWLYSDHYKWRAMRTNGIDERFITGDASDYEKFMAWAETMPMVMGNPLYHWTHLELQRYFGIHDILNKKTAPAIWNKTNELLNGKGFGARDLINKSNVKILCTTDDPTDSLEYHIKLKEDTEFNVKVLPALRPDKGLQINANDFNVWVKKLEGVYKNSINDYNQFLKALESRVKFFHSVGCRISDHGFSSLTYVEPSRQEVEYIFKKALKGQKVTKKEEDMYVIYTLQFLGRLYSELGWTMQLHIGALRNNNTKMFTKLGPDSGFDSINDERVACSISRLLDSLEVKSVLPKTILYTLNPKDNYVLSAMIGNFQEAKVPGKIQFGSAWWFLDNKDGMVEQMKTLANTGLLSRFVGMLTDSRSFLSYTRHEYFRRILCNLMGRWVEDGEVPADMEFLGGIVEGICFKNAKEYFNINC